MRQHAMKYNPRRDAEPVFIGAATQDNKALDVARRGRAVSARSSAQCFQCDI